MLDFEVRHGVHFTAQNDRLVIATASAARDAAGAMRFALRFAPSTYCRSAYHRAGQLVAIAPYIHLAYARPSGRHHNGLEQRALAGLRLAARCVAFIAWLMCLAWAEVLLFVLTVVV